MIELVQLMSRRGLFEFDDIIHNTIGTAIGFGLIVLIQKLIGKQKTDRTKTMGR